MNRVPRTTTVPWTTSMWPTGDSNEQALTHFQTPRRSRTKHLMNCFMTAARRGSSCQQIENARKPSVQTYGSNDYFLNFLLDSLNVSNVRAARAG